MSGTLFIVATPIGNLKDITLRALDILSQVDLIACEDTRRTTNLLAHYQIKKPLISYHEHNEIKRIPELINCLQNGQNIALVSDAGTPTISDPGFKLVREAIARGLDVQSIPGASAVLASLVISGKPTDKFFFFGYLPPKGGKRNKALLHLKNFIREFSSTVILFESPYRLIRTLTDLQTSLGDHEIVILRELTKLYEEAERGKISKLLSHFVKKKIKGELTIVI